MQHRERRARAELRPFLRRRLAEAERGGREAGRAVQHVLARGGRHGRQRLLEQLAHDAEGELALQQRAAGAQHAEPAALGGAAQRGDHRGLADARRTLDERRAAAAVARRLERLLEAAEHLIALEEL